MQTIVSSLTSPWRKLGSILMLGGLLAGISGAQAQANKQAEDAYLGANGLFNLGLYEQAIGAYTVYLKKWPTHAKVIHAQRGMGISHYKLKQYDKAAAALGKIVGNPKCPNPPETNLFWGLSLLMLEKPANAETAFNTGIKALAAPKDKNEQQLLANLKAMQLEALFKQEKWKDVVTASAALKATAGSRASRVAYQGAFAMYQLQQYKAAGAAFTTLKPAVKGTPLQQQAHFLLGECLRKQEQFPAAIKEFEVAASLEGRDAPEALYRVSLLQFNLKDYTAAAKNFDGYRVKYRGQVGPERFTDARIYLGRAQVELKQYPQAEKVYTDLAAEPKAGAKVFLWQGRMFQAQAKYAEAVKALDAALKKFPADELRPAMLYDFANNNLGLDQFKEAGETFDALRKEQPKFEDMAVVLHQNAICKHNLKDFKNSLQLCADFLKDHATHERAADVTFLHCENQFFLDDHKAAITGFKAFATTHKTHAKVNLAQMRIGQSEYELKQWKNVLTVLEPLLVAKVKGEEFDQLEFFIGESYFRQDNWAKAVPVFLLFVEAKPKSTNADTALLMAGLSSEKLDKKAEAIAAYQKLETGYPQSEHLPHARVQLGTLFYHDKKYAPARAALGKVVALPKHELRPEAQYWLAWVEVGEDKFAEAATQFGALADANPQHDRAAEARLRQGMELFTDEQFPAAQAALTKFIADHAAHKNIDEATYHVGFAQMKQKQWTPALASFVKVPAKSEWKDDALYQSAWCEKENGKPDQAAPHYIALLKDFPASDLANNATLELAELNFEAKKLDAVVTDLQALIAKKPKPELLARAQYRLGWSYFEQKKFAEGAKSFEAMLTGAPEDLLVTAAWQAGQCRWETKEYTPALANFQKAVAAKKPTGKEQLVLHEQALLRVGQCQGQLSQWPVAEASFKKFIAAHPKHDHIRDAQYGLGRALKGQKKYPEAMTAFEPVVSEGIRDELGAQAQFLKGECHLEQNKFDEAIAEYIKVEALYKFPDWQSKAVFELAQALDRKGQKEAAKKQLERLVATYPETDAAKAAKARLN